MILRKGIVENFVKRYPDIVLVDLEIPLEAHSQVRADTDKAVQHLLTEHPDLRAIWSTWDAFAHGVTDALVAQKRTDIFVYTFDLGSEDIALMQHPSTPPMSVVACNAVEIGRITIRVATLAACGQNVEAQYLIPMHVIQRVTLERTITSPEWLTSESGWTPWLHSRWAIGQNQPYSPLTVVDIIDFDNRQFHDINNIGGHIAHMLGREYFTPYMQELRAYRELESQRATVSREQLDHQQAVLTECFIAAFNAQSRQQRIVLLFDTTDALVQGDTHLTVLDHPIMDDLLPLLARLQDTLILIAGRDADLIRQQLATVLNKRVKLLALHGFPPETSAHYLLEKQRATRTALEPELMDKLLYLARGRPILLDLAVEWRSRGIPLEWIGQIDVAHLMTLSEEERQTHTEAFERKLVGHIGEGRQLIDWLILLLTRIYPIDETLIGQFFEIDEDETAKLVEEARSYVFIKTLPDAQLSLHDEMRRMVNDYVWPAVDPLGTLQQQHSHTIAAYVKQQLVETQQQIALLKEKQTSESELLTLFYEDEKLKRTLPVLGEQLVFHTLIADPAAGIAEFADLFDQRQYDHRFRERLLAIVAPVMTSQSDQFTPEQHYTYQSRKVKYLLDMGNYADAYTIVQTLLAHRTWLSASQCIDMLIQRANLEIRQGSIETGITTFDEAIRLCEQYGLDDWRARVLNGRGWAYRNQGDYAQALDDYRTAYDSSIDAQDDHRIAAISNNMGYVYGILGHMQLAFDYCEDALKTWNRLGHERYIGSTYSTLGEIARWFGKYDQAQEYYDQALTIFESQNDNEWISIVKTGKGLVLLAQGQLDAAHMVLQEALPLAPANVAPRILHHLAYIEWNKGNLVAAQKQFETCRTYSQKTGMYEYDFRSFADLLDIYWEQGHYAWWPELRGELTQIMTKSKNIWLEGSSLRKLADLALCQRHYEPALHLYQESILKIAEHTVWNVQTIHRSYTLTDQLKRTEERLRKLGLTDVLSRLGQDLAAFWPEYDILKRDYTRARAILRQWQIVPTER